MISTATGGTVINYSDRFSLSGMTGTFPANVQTGLKGLSGTNGPTTENNVDTNAAAVPANGQAGGPYAVTYTAQTGLTKYAPMQGKPGTKITAKNPTPQYPTSSVNIAKTILPTPSQVTTMTVSATYSASSHENTVCIYIGAIPWFAVLLVSRFDRLRQRRRLRTTCKNILLDGVISGLRKFCFWILWLRFSEWKIMQEYRRSTYAWGGAHGCICGDQRSFNAGGTRPPDTTRP